MQPIHKAKRCPPYDLPNWIVVMFEILQAITVISVSMAIALPLAHALEWPGKMRLLREQYIAVQSIYYPGFTYAAFSEPVSLLLLLILLIWWPTGTAEFWLIAAAFFALLVMHGTYWILTHPINKFWLEDFKLTGFGRRFFAFGIPKQTNAAKPDWIYLRDRWEFSHVIRAALGMTSFVLLVIAVVASAANLRPIRALFWPIRCRLERTL